MKILIVSGFLGAGKTTFIKELIRRSDTHPVILENEYGDNSIDAEELREIDADASKLEVLEFMEGCVCCTMKDSFVNSVFTVFSSLSPEYLIVEPTGVGRLSNIIANLQPLLHGDISLLKPVVVITPRSFRQNMAEWGELYADQVANAQIVIFSKCESDSPEELALVESAVRDINPHAEIVSEHYSARDDEWWRSVLALPAQAVQEQDSSDESVEISQVTLDSARLDNPAQLILVLEDCLRGELGRIVRAKGTVPAGGEMLRFDLADGRYAVSGSQQEANQCVFIGKDLDEAAICRRMGGSSPVKHHHHH